MSKESFKNRMNKLPDKELIAILKERHQYQKNAIDAAIEVAESRNLNFEEIRKEIADERLGAEIDQKELNEERQRKIIELTPKIIGIYQIVGGVFLILSSLFISPFQLKIITQISLLLFASFSVIAGYLLLKEKKNGILLSVINQALQIIKFQIFSYGFKYYTPLFLGLVITDELSFGLDIQPGMSFILGPSEPDYNMFFGMNLIAIAAIYYVYKYKELNTNK
ncbi:hypothetical protein J8L88_23375 [Aquimarina sp. MMG015]|uniref:hypothetical protein n=1 Tax=Aquimarina sp. MMG015 TaxID=2822689 RepID=UPI001B3A1E33|nr:hypothetical protein [Aquimarina sp. MMG015]MBQ4805818.1 hypothetical protein [Aquimarina sp. MMG015]